MLQQKFILVFLAVVLSTFFVKFSGTLINVFQQTQQIRVFQQEIGE